MKETLEVVIAFGFEAMNLQCIEADIVPENARSVGLLEKLGFQLMPERDEGFLTYHLLK